jgi:hypothetical protein
MAGLVNDGFAKMQAITPRPRFFVKLIARGANYTHC